MKKTILLFALITYSLVISAQQNNRFAVGFNFQPVLANSYEVIGEVKFSDHWTLSEKFGYAGKANFFRISQNDFYKTLLISGVEKRVTSSGYFLKSCIKYTLKNRFFIQAGLIMSLYTDYSTFYDVDNGNSTYSGSMKYSGLFWGPLITCGYRAGIIKDRLFFDMGIQFSYDMINKRREKESEYYEPGAGGNLTFPIRCQGLMGLMLAF